MAVAKYIAITWSEKLLMASLGKGGGIGNKVNI